jgi:Domain of unknown function (DU1801)
MLSPIDNYFLHQEEPIKSCLQSLRQHIKTFDKNISEKWQYGMPFFYYGKKRFVYLWVHKKFRQPYLGIVDGKLIEHPDLLQEKRARMKIFLVDAGKDIPLQKINTILKRIVALYK